MRGSLFLVEELVVGLVVLKIARSVLLSLLAVVEVFVVAGQGVELPCDRVLLVDVEVLQDVVGVSDEEEQKAAEDDVDSKRHYEGVEHPHEEEGRNVEKEQLSHEVLETQNALLLQVINCNV